MIGVTEVFLKKTSAKIVGNNQKFNLTKCPLKMRAKELGIFSLTDSFTCEFINKFECFNIC